MEKSKPEPTIWDIRDFLKSVCDIKQSTIRDDDGKCYYSKVDGSYVERLGVEEQSLFLLKHGITEQIQNGTDHNVANIGFNPEEQKWYGWSHRAVYGFGVGSKCKKGHAHYKPGNKEDWIENTIQFWCGDDPYFEWSKGVEGEDEEGNLGLWIISKYNNKVPNKALRGTERKKFLPFPDTYGHGEWVAKTLEDAKQMACDFAEGVS